MRKTKKLSLLQPVQIGTVELEPNCAIPGVIGAPVDVVGTKLAALVTLTRNTNVRMPDGTYRITCTVTGAAGTGKYTISHIDTGIVTAEQTSSATAIAGLVPGVDVKVASCTDAVADDYCEFVVVGDQTYIIPGTVLARKTATGKWVPATDALVSSGADAFRVCASYQETDKTKTVLPHGYENSSSLVYTVEVIVFGEVYESVCDGINMTDTIKAKLNGIVWL